MKKERENVESRPEGRAPFLDVLALEHEVSRGGGGLLIEEGFNYFPVNMFDLNTPTNSECLLLFFLFPYITGCSKIFAT
jgi:hypothetical protein